MHAIFEANVVDDTLACLDDAHPPTGFDTPRMLGDEMYALASDAWPIVRDHIIERRNWHAEHVSRVIGELGLQPCQPPNPSPRSPTTPSTSSAGSPSSLQTGRRWSVRGQAGLCPDTCLNEVSDRRSIRGQHWRSRCPACSRELPHVVS